MANPGNGGGFHLTGPMHGDGAKLVFDDTDKTGSETFWRQIDATHFEEVTTASLPWADLVLSSYS